MTINELMERLHELADENYGEWEVVAHDGQIIDEVSEDPSGCIFWLL